MIKVISNFISLSDAATLIKYIDENSPSFSSDNKGLWFKKFFGIDDIYKHGKGEPVIDGLGAIKEVSINIVEAVKTSMSEHFMDTEPIFLNSLWFAKHLPGDNVQAHVDTEEGYNQQFVYSAILYLNTVEDGGVLNFPKLNLSFKPKACDLIIFPSGGDNMVHEVMGIGENRYTLPMWFTKDKDLELKFT
jgi:hypothetical protein